MISYNQTILIQCVGKYTNAVLHTLVHIEWKEGVLKQNQSTPFKPNDLDKDLAMYKQC